MYAPDASILHGKIIPTRDVAPRGGAVRQVLPTPAATPHPSLLGRLFHRPEPTFYQRCLAVHIHFASENSGMH